MNRLEKRIEQMENAAPAEGPIVIAEATELPTGEKCFGEVRVGGVRYSRDDYEGMLERGEIKPRLQINMVHVLSRYATPRNLETLRKEFPELNPDDVFTGVVP